MNPDEDRSELDFRVRAECAGGFDLAGFDAWLRAMPRGPQRDYLHELRAKAKAIASLEAIAPVLMNMALLQFISLREDHLLPLAKTGTAVKRGQSGGGNETAKKRQSEARERDDTLAARVRAILKANPRLSNADLARRLADASGRGRAALEKKMPALRELATHRV
jgi:hypothetical protein